MIIKFPPIFLDGYLLKDLVGNIPWLTLGCLWGPSCGIFCPPCSRPSSRVTSMQDVNMNLCSFCPQRTSTDPWHLCALQHSVSCEI